MMLDIFYFVISAVSETNGYTKVIQSESNAKDFHRGFDVLRAERCEQRAIVINGRSLW